MERLPDGDGGEISRRALMLGALGICATGLFAAKDPFKLLEDYSTAGSNPPYIGFDTAWVSTHYADDPDNPSALLNAEEMRRDGVGFHIAKAGEGVDYDDRFFKESRERADNAGILFGAYQVLKAGNAIAQAKAAIERLEDSGGTKGIINLVDVQKYPTDETGPSLQNVYEYCGYLQEKIPSAPVVIYTFDDYWNNLRQTGSHSHGSPPAAPPRTELWWPGRLKSAGQTKAGEAFALAAELSPPHSAEDPYPANKVADWPSYAIRQFSNRAQYQRFKAIDCNISFLPWKDLVALAGLEPGDLPEPVRR